MNPQFKVSEIYNNNKERSEKIALKLALIYSVLFSKNTSSQTNVFGTQ